MYRYAGGAKKTIKFVKTLRRKTAKQSRDYRKGDEWRSTVAANKGKWVKGKLVTQQRKGFTL